ncbi:MAG: CopG family transcriptional regulator [Candidatus Freyarchaeota archaeon]|nr:hypothetical protein [Candidatus Freyrarchaeum guaymaensis]HDO81157.1 CopG family transcriptional regulator [Candidatus Bathyarchaeota archaeon]
MSKEKVPVFISKELYDDIQKKVEESQGEFESVEDYVEFVLREVTKEEFEEDVYSPEEEEEIKKRLKGLGYL